MSISAIGPATSVPPNRIASDGDSAAVEAVESRATQSAETKNGGVAPKAAAPAPESAAKPSSSGNDLAKLRMYAQQHLSASAIATRLGKSVSAVMQEAAAAGINLNAASTTDASVATWHEAVGIGNNVNVKA